MGLKPTVARYALADPGPQLTETILLAERVHRALVELSDGSAVFTGCDSSKRPLQGHRHAHIFCESIPCQGRESRGEITNISIYAPMGFDSREEEALQRLKEIYDDQGASMSLVLLGLGQPAELGSTSPLFSRSRSWISHTPFLPTRHPKATRAGVPKVDSTGFQIGSPEHELLRLLGLAGFPEPDMIERVGHTRLGERDVPWDAFVRRRGADERRPAANGAGYGFRIVFAEAVQGPVAVGYGGHFGMGMFMIDRIENSEDESMKEA
jgi:CRISPR-associated protein Csb2